MFVVLQSSYQGNERPRRQLKVHSPVYLELRIDHTVLLPRKERGSTNRVVLERSKSLRTRRFILHMMHSTYPRVHTFFDVLMSCYLENSD